MTEHDAHIHKPTDLDLGTVRPLADTPLRGLFVAAVKHGASDLLLRGGFKPRLRVGGVLRQVDTSPVNSEELTRWVDTCLSDRQRRALTDEGSLDIGVEISPEDGQVHRFRTNIFRSRSQIVIVARRVNNTIPDFESLHLPPVLNQIAQLQHGLVLIAGTSGSGKSTTIASLIQHINENRACHIITLEDPIEYLFPEAKAMVSQREIGIDVPSYVAGVRALVREDPDVVLIGELRDRETFEAALQAAETGHLVFGTVHSPSTSQAFGRVYDLFTPDAREAVRNTLAYQLQALVCQKLLPTIKDGVPRIPAVEVLLQSPTMHKYILDGREHELDQVIKNERHSGMQTFTDSLIHLVNTELIHPKTALAGATSPIEVKMRLKGIDTGQ